MNRALAHLTVVAYVTLVVEAVGTGLPAPAVVLGAVYAVLGTAGYAWVCSPRRRSTVAAIAYVAVQLPLGFLLFSVANATTGATLLLLVLVSQSVRLLPLPGAALVTAAVPLAHLGMDWGAGLREALGTLAAALFAAGSTWLHLREQQARMALAEANEQLREFASQAEQLATTQERNRLARDIHDGLGHHLTVVQMQVQAARAVLSTDPPRADAVLAQAQRQASEALDEVRRSVAALREPRATPPLADALAELAAETSAAGVPTTVELAGPARVLAPETEESLYRAAQEGLTNVRKHAEASQVRLVLAYGAAAVALEVRDDGTGEVGETPGFGLVGLRERASALGGTVATEAMPGRGTTLRIEVPG